MELLAPIVGVTVHPARARVTRRGRAELPAGPTELVVAPLPESLIEDSIRVTGRAGTAVRIVGVDLLHRDLAAPPEDRVRDAEAAVRDAERAVATIDGADAGDAARAEMLAQLARKGGNRLAAALAAGTAGVARVAEIGALLSAQLAEVAANRRGNAERRADAQHELDAARAALARLHGSGRHRRETVIEVEAEAAGVAEFELTYVVDGARWASAYDARLTDAGRVSLSWFGLVEQGTGEDWPACELTLSTARPAVSATVPELDPWWIDVRPPRPPMPPMMARAALPAPGGAVQPAAAHAMAEFDVSAEAVVATAVTAGESGVSGSWRLARPTAVPGDRTPHRTTVAVFDLTAQLDHVTAPLLSPDAHLRATVTNTSGQVLLAGPASTFLEDAFVGTTSIGQTAPDEDIEIALGVDDRVVVERELAARTVHKARFGTSRGSGQRWTITVTNRRPGPARVTVRDRLPVSRHADVKVVDVKIVPEPTDRDDVGRLEWTVPIAPGGRWEASVQFGVEHPKDTPLSGW